MGRPAYVSNLGSGTLSIIDLESQIVRNIEVGNYPVFSFFYPHDRSKLLVTLHNYHEMEDEGALELVDPITGDIQKFSYRGIAVHLEWHTMKNGIHFTSPTKIWTWSTFTTEKR